MRTVGRLLAALQRLLIRNWFSISLGLLLTGKAVMYAYHQRGYVAVGGEWLIFPAVLLAVHTYRIIVTVYIELIARVSSGERDD